MMMFMSCQKDFGNEEIISNNGEIFYLTKYFFIQKLGNIIKNHQDI